MKKIKQTHLLIKAPKSDKEREECSGFAIELGNCESDNAAIEKAKKCFHIESGDVVVKIIAESESTLKKV